MMVYMSKFEDKTKWIPFCINELTLTSVSSTSLILFSYSLGGLNSFGSLGSGIRRSGTLVSVASAASAAMALVIASVTAPVTVAKSWQPQGRPFRRSLVTVSVTSEVSEVSAVAVWQLQRQLQYRKLYI